MAGGHIDHFAAVAHGELAPGLLADEAELVGLAVTVGVLGQRLGELLEVVEIPGIALHVGPGILQVGGSHQVLVVEYTHIAAETHRQRPTLALVDAHVLHHRAVPHAVLEVVVIAQTQVVAGHALLRHHVIALHHRDVEVALPAIASCSTVAIRSRIGTVTILNLHLYFLATSRTESA